MKKLALLLFLPFMTLLATPVYTHAINLFEDACNSAPTTGENASSTCAQRTETGDPLTGGVQKGIIIRAAELLARITGILSVIIIIYGSIKYVMSSGEAASVEAAKNTIMYALIGLVVAVSAQGIITFVISRTN